MKFTEVVVWIGWVVYMFVLSLIGAGLAGVWLGLARRFFYLGLYWVATDGPVRATWPLF